MTNIDPIHGSRQVRFWKLELQLDTKDSVQLLENQQEAPLRYAAPVLSLALLVASVPASAWQRDEDSTRRWRDDIAWFRQELPRRHINPFHDLSGAEFERLTTDLDARVSSLRDHEIIVGLTRIVARLGPRDGHSRVNLFNPALKFHRLPVNVYAYSDGLFVRAVSNDYVDLLGTRVISIGGKPVDDVVQRVKTITPADNPMSKTSWSAELMTIPEVLHALGIGSGEPAGPVTFEVQEPDGTRRKIEVKALQSLDGVVWQDIRSTARASPMYRRWASIDPFNRHGAQKNFWFEYLAERKLLYVNYSAVVDMSDETVAAFFDRVFAFADKNPVEKFVLDIRNNSGGNNYLNRPIFYGLIKRAETVARSGAFFAVIGRETFSAAQNLANLLDEHTDAILVGEPTGGSPNHYGDSLRMELPNSKVSVGLSSVWWQDLDPRDFRLWIAPHIAAELTSGDDRTGRDPALEAIVNYAPEVALIDTVREALTKGGKAEAARALASWRSDPRHKFLNGESELNRLGARLFREKKPDDAVVIFELNASTNPDSWLAQNSLGRTYAAVGRKEEAAAAYQRALRIRPNAPQTLSVLDQLK